MKGKSGEKVARKFCAIVPLEPDNPPFFVSISTHGKVNSNLKTGIKLLG